MKIILPANVKSSDIRIAAAYLIATKEDDVKGAVAISSEELESNVYSEEVLMAIKNGLSKTLHDLLGLYARTNVCEAAIDETFDPITAVEKVVEALKQDYKYCLSKIAAA